MKYAVVILKTIAAIFIALCLTVIYANSIFRFSQYSETEALILSIFTILEFQYFINRNSDRRL